MNRYRIYCTTGQIKKALELGAPIEVDFQFNDKTAIINKKAYIIVLFFAKIIRHLELPNKATPQKVIQKHFFSKACTTMCNIWPDINIITKGIILLWAIEYK